MIILKNLISPFQLGPLPSGLFIFFQTISGKCLTKENKACYEGSWNEVQGKPGKGAVGCWQDDPSKKNWCATEVTDDVWHEYTKWGYCRMDMDTCTFGEFQC